MLPDLPQFDVKSSGPRAGWAINKIFDRLDAQQLRSSDTVQISDEQGGQRVTRLPVVAGVSSSFDLGFAVTYSVSIITVAAGKVCVPSWGGIDGEDPFPADWQVESNYVGGTISAASTAAWLEVVLTASDTDTVGPLGDEPLALNGGAGGRGAGGGGGGASRGNTSTTTVGEASGGQDGELGGAGGAGALVYNVSDGLPTSGLTTGEGSDGGTGGAGGAGGAGTSSSFTRPTKAIASIKTYAVSSIVLHATKGTASATSTWIKLATITGGVVSQHHLGTVHITPPAITYVET